MYRIISGKWKGKKIAAPKNFEVRPTTDFAKEALFSIIEHRFDIEYLSVLDLFAGIGSISLEFASRDTKDITSVDLNPKHCGFINSTAKELGFDAQVNISRGDVFDWVKKERNHGKLYNLVFADPPFDMDKAKYDELIDLVLSKNILAENGVFILEHQSRQKFEHPNLQETRKYGNVSFSFFAKKTD
ncbi:MULTISPECIES: RsmD family RNA methyltransferase [Elizabethkingia]|uniref:RsmD family RNA methyltransferase n=1 Tax=Elizabethkingia TaxID=308865 RepID=UPI00209E769F|nr:MULTISPECIES: RsmD family RNA methyltransferase [unclassified Elizabethkingia]MCP1252986.1 23S rRNA (adenine(2030)-N(6))-methyltransferase RlmJ [Elizabethkingia sp. S0634]MDX8573659.1 23S rRNA (adenine(2030)-N(6))-methyltransferase RlmJ [Elizabethkingia sp. HX QKY]